MTTCLEREVSVLASFEVREVSREVRVPVERQRSEGGIEGSET